MKCYFFYTVLFVLLISCNKKKKEFYRNGNVKLEYSLNRGRINGEFKEYYENGNLKESHFYQNDKLIDSSFYYEDKLMKSLNRIVIHLNDTLKLHLKYGDNQSLVSKGKTLKSKRFDKWTFYKTDYDSIVEYVNLNQDSYVNQVWSIRKDGDTLDEKSNYFSFYIQRDKEYSFVDEVLRINVSLIEPFFNYNSDLELLITENEDEFNRYLSYNDKVIIDTIKSMKNDGIKYMNLPKGLPINHTILFDMSFSTSGKKKIYGSLVEYLYNNDGKKLERRLIFVKTISILDR